MSIKVKFSVVQEFLDELLRDGATDKIKNNIVRATAVYIPTNSSPNIRMVFLVATYRRDDEVIELRRLCGDVWVGIETGVNDSTEGQYETELAIIEDFCNRHGLELRPGMLEQVG